MMAKSQPIDPKSQTHANTVWALANDAHASSVLVKAMQRWQKNPIEGFNFPRNREYSVGIYYSIASAFEGFH